MVLLCYPAGGERTFLHTLAAMLSDIVLVARGPERKAFAIALWLAFFDQVSRFLLGLFPI